MPRTYGETLGRAMEITDRAEADRYFAELVAESEAALVAAGRGGADPRAEAERVVRSNLGYYAGYYSDEVRARVERLFRCAHPVFGAIGKNGPPTPEAAFEAGRALGEAARRRAQ
mgnify:CR=1 FL=1